MVAEHDGTIRDEDEDEDNNSDDKKDTCNMCGGSGYLDTEGKQVCPNCNGTGQA